MKHRIVILGAGYAGATAAGRLGARLHEDDVEITLVNAEPDFVERVRLHQLAAGQDLQTHPLHDILAGTGVRVDLARVTRVDPDDHIVGVEDEDGSRELGYDTLVYALGSAVDDHDVPGVREHADEVASRAGSLRLRERLRTLPDSATVTVVGGGLTGLEASTEIAEAFPRLSVRLVTHGALGDWLSASGRRHLRATTDRLGIVVHEHGDIATVGHDHLVTTGGTRIPTDITVWAGGFVTNPIAASSALSTGDRGRIVVDETMRSVSHPDVYAIGDAALAKGPRDNTLRMSCASGIPMAWQAADSIVARLTGGRLPHTPLRYVQQCISLGRDDGIIQTVTPDDRAHAFAPSGRAAAAYKEFICRSAAWVVGHPTAFPRGRRRVATAPATAPATA